MSEMGQREIIQMAIYAALGHVKLDYRSPKRLHDAAGVIADFVIAAELMQRPRPPVIPPEQGQDERRCPTIAIC